MQPDEFADVVVGVVKAALAPLQERLATAEQCNKDIRARLDELLGLRDRLVVVETKAEMPSQVLSAIDVQNLHAVPPVDLTPVLERLTAAETRQADLKDRVLVAETKAAYAPPAPALDLQPVCDRLINLERRPFVTEEFKSFLRDELSSLRERVSVVEVRPPVAGPQGEPGQAGKDGADGKDGTAGLSFEGVYQEGKSYDLGHLVTWAGSSWHCNEPTTTKPGDGSKAWTLMVKRGRDGRDGHDAAGALPVVSVGRAQ